MLIKDLRIAKNVVNDEECITIFKLPYGMSNIIFNVIRKIAIGFLPSFKVFAVEINNIQHEFQNITNVYNRTFEILNNFSNLVFEINDDSLQYKEEIIIGTLSVKNKGIYKANQINFNHTLKILNNDDNILEVVNDLEDKAFDIKIYIKYYTGFLMKYQNAILHSEIKSAIFLDTNFSSVKSIYNQIDEYKIDNFTKRENLHIFIKPSFGHTDIQIISFVFNEIKHIFNILCSLVEENKLSLENSITAINFDFLNIQKKIEKEERITLDELSLSQRSYNCLKSNNILYLDELTKLTKKELRQMKNIGSISFNEICEIVEKYNMKFLDDEEEEIINE